jgi:hypothetical protein
VILESVEGLAGRPLAFEHDRFESVHVSLLLL